MRPSERIKGIANALGFEWCNAFGQESFPTDRVLLQAIIRYLDERDETESRRVWFKSAMVLLVPGSTNCPLVNGYLEKARLKTRLDPYARVDEVLEELIDEAEREGLLGELDEAATIARDAQKREHEA